MKDRMLDFSNHVTEDENMVVSATTLAYSGTKKNFRECFCVNEIAKTDFFRTYFCEDVLLLIPGKQVVGRGLKSKVEQCIITIRKKGADFIFNNGDLFEDDIAQPLGDDCMLIFLGDVEEAFILLPDSNDLEKHLFRLEDDVEVGVYLETDLYRGCNRYHLCLVKDINYNVNLCSVTADPRTAEFLYRFFINYCG